MKKHIKVFPMMLFVLLITMGFVSDDSTVSYYTNSPLIRFHVIANSNSPSDQALKLKVRDAVIKEMTPILADAENKEEARKRVDQSFEQIKSTAQRVMSQNGYSYPVQVMRGNFDFPEKTYHIQEQKKGEVMDLTLPAGRYEAVRVVIGSGKGANWWCVLFPPLCFVNPEDGSKEKELGKALAVQYDPKTQETVEYRLKMVDWYRQAKNYLAL